MGYRHGVNWTDEMVKEEIKKVMKALHINRMPSRSEVELVRRDTSLTNRISRSGGYREWALKLGLKTKESDSSKGWRYEEKAQKALEERGFDVKKMTTKHPYDLLIESSVKVDVKVSSRYYYEKENYYHTFSLDRKYHAYDFILGYCLDDNAEVEKVLIIPTISIMKIKQISLGAKSDYDKFKDRWDLIKNHADSMERLGKLI